MSATTRAQVLEAIRQALTAGAEARLPQPLPAGPAAREETLVAQFIREAECAGAQVATVGNAAAAREQICRWLEARGARHIVCASTPGVLELGLNGLSLLGAKLAFFDTTTSAEERRQRALAADVGLGEADYGLADTGTLAVQATPLQGRLVSLLPPVHVAVLSRKRIVADLAACFRALAVQEAARRSSLLTLITGPSRTADIEQTLTLGVHGPGALYILLVA